jgi:hypothetical protein
MKHADRIERTKGANMGGWQERHVSAIRYPQGVEQGMVSLLRGWLDYADAHMARFESRIGEDYILGPAWAQIGSSVRTLLNGELGRLDGGTLDSLICESLEAEGYNPEEL